MTFASSVSFSFIVNGSPKGYLIPTQGLQQGDHISLYLFLLCVEGLSTLIAKWKEDGKIQGISICSGASIVNRLLFTDDNLLFCHANEGECSQISNILQFYKRASGHKVNLLKSEVRFSRNINHTVQQRLASFKFVGCSAGGLS